jgi:hypothetical protein
LSIVLGREYEKTFLYHNSKTKEWRSIKRHIHGVAA